MARLIRGLVPLYTLLKSRRAGEVVTKQEVMSATGWKPSTLVTYLNKGKLRALLAPGLADHEFRVVIDGASLRQEDVAAALTQVTERPAPLAKEDRLQGNLAEYVLVEKLGEGAVGQVWKARTRAGALVAVKVCNPRPDLLDPTVLDEVRNRFKREYRLGVRVANEFLIPYRDTGEHHGMPFLVMDLAEGSVADELRARRTVDLETSLKIIEPVARALAWLHSQNCVHRDVKPANILIVGGRYIVGDLGIVRWGDMSKSFTGAGTLTRTAVQLGSWFYMAPEQRQAPHDASPASDTYALAITWIELLSGVTPDPAQVAAGKVPPPSGHAEIDAMLRRMTAYTPEDRPTLAEVLELVARWAAAVAIGAGKA